MPSDLTSNVERPADRTHSSGRSPGSSVVASASRVAKPCVVGRTVALTKATPVLLITCRLFICFASFSCDAQHASSCCSTEELAGLPKPSRAKMRDDEGEVESPRRHRFQANALEQTVTPLKPAFIACSDPRGNQLRVSPSSACFECEGSMCPSSAVLCVFMTTTS